MNLFYTLLLTAIISFTSSGELHAQNLPYAQLLNKYSSQGFKKGIKTTLVDYQQWGKDALHNKALESLQKTNPEPLSGTKKMAFWINAYNLLTVDLIIKNNEKESIKNLGNFLRSPWKSHSWIIYGQKYTLDEIEHAILRPMKDPRIHVAINCASLSCPDLLSEPYDSQKLNQQLTQQTKLFLSNETKGLYSGNYGVKISMIFKWFKEDFGGEDGVTAFINKYSQRNLKNSKYNDYFEYDWNLNSK